MDATEWYIHDQGRTFGPLPVETVQAWATDGRLTAQAQMARRGDKAWVAVETELGITMPSPTSPPSTDAMGGYETMAETVGMLPSFNRADTRFQAKWAGIGSLAGLIIGAIVGATMKGADHYSWFIGAMVGLGIGLVGATFISGAIVGVRGLKRAKKKR